MSKINISKNIEGVDICSENMIGISENLTSISEKVSAISKVIVEIVSEFQTEADKPAIETKAKKSEPKQIEAKAEPVKEAAKKYTFTEVRTVLAEALMGKKKFEEVLGKYVTKPQGKPALVPESDKRPAINTAFEDFSEN